MMAGFYCTVSLFLKLNSNSYLLDDHNLGTFNKHNNKKGEKEGNKNQKREIKTTLLFSFMNGLTVQ